MSTAGTLEETYIDLERIYYQESFYHFFLKSFDILHPGLHCQDNWHIRKICNRIQLRARDMMEGKEGKNLIINIPPRSLKSQIVTVAFPAWLWTQDPRIKVIASSYSATLSTEHNMMTRQVIESDWFQTLWGDRVTMAGDQNQKTFFKNTVEGFRKCTSTGGSVTGSGGDVIIVDDPVNPNQAESEADRENSNVFFDRTLTTRLNDPSKGFFIIVMQRLHVNDLTGHVMNRDPERWDHIVIPATLGDQVSPAKYRDYYQDNLFFPARFTPAVLSAYKKALGSYGYAGQMDQLPAPEGGGIWQKWFIEMEDHLFPGPGELTSLGTDWDLAYTEKDTNSASAYVTAGKKDGKMYITNFGFVRFEFPDLIKFMNSQPDPHYIEAKASGKSAKQVLTKQGIPAIEVQVKGGDKIARARNVTPHAEAGLVVIRKSMADQLYSDTEQGILVFPNGLHSDLADALAQSIQRIFGKRKAWGV